MKHLAVVIPLNNTLLSQTLKCLDLLSGKYSLKYHASHSSIPHITITSGRCVSRKIFQKAVYSCIPQCRKITIRSNGLGIFVKEVPVIYIRWFLSKELSNLCRLFQERMLSIWSRIDDTSVEGVWLPKSTLALKDTSYEQLPSVLEDLAQFNFQQNMLVDKLTLLEIESKEIVIEEISIN